MYSLPHFKENNQQEILAFMRKHPFVFLSGCDDAKQPVVTQVPVFVDEHEGKYFLTGHIMRKSDHHKAFLANPQVLAVFSGPHTYVSATWYDNPHQASTWNYMSVHARGRIRFGTEEELIAILRRLTLFYENNNAGSTTIYDNLPPAYVESLIKAIISFEIEVSELENVFKLSQNRDQKSYENIIRNLEQQDESGRYIAGEMRKRSSQLFK